MLAKTNPVSVGFLKITVFRDGGSMNKFHLRTVNCVIYLPKSIFTKRYPCVFPVISYVSRTSSQDDLSLQYFSSTVNTKHHEHKPMPRIRRKYKYSIFKTLEEAIFQLKFFIKIVVTLHFRSNRRNRLTDNTIHYNVLYLQKKYFVKKGSTNQ